MYVLCIRQEFEGTWSVQRTCFEAGWGTCMYGIPVSFSEPPLGNKGLMSRCLVLPYVPPSLIQLGNAFRSLKAGVCQEMAVRS